MGPAHPFPEILFVEEIEEIHKVLVEDVGEGVSEMGPDCGHDEKHQRRQDDTCDGEGLAIALAEKAYQREGEAEDTKDETYKRRKYSYSWS
ncbi:MAG: hypothetical protein PUF10_01700 [Bacteroidales bacterium]|nr:hypothetical protein [Bacteroidales bacterium]